MELIDDRLTLVEFIEACDSALRCARPTIDGCMPGVDVPRPDATLKAFLLFLANEALAANSPAIDADRVARWHARVTPALWRRLGFERPPALLTLQLAFALLGGPEHVAAELRALVWVIGDLAASGVLRSLTA